MKKEEVLRKLNQIIITHKAYIAATERIEKEKICICENESIHILNGIEYLADVAGEKLVSLKRNDDVYPYRYSFEYRGTKIYQIGAQEFPPEVHWDED